MYRLFTQRTFHLYLHKYIRLGSISAEHGIGQQKTHLLAEMRSESEIDVMRTLKQSLDPNGILNPGKVLLLT